MIPIVMPLKVVIPPASYTLASHVPIFLAMFLSRKMAAMMCRHSLDLPQVADAIEKAVEQVLLDGYRTGDIYREGLKRVGTTEMAQAVIERL